MNRIFKLVIFISSLNFGDCVVGGERVEDTTSHPYQAILSYEDKPACGGTIISKKHILTDARCFFNLLGGSVTSKQWVARVGSIQGNKGGTVIPVEKIHLPDKYNGEPEMNVALAALRAQINETKYVALIAMPTKDDVTGKTDLILTGYGINEVTRPRKYRYYLHRVKLTTMDFDSCKKVLPDVNFGNYTFCAQSSSPAGACFGDMGSPIVRINGNDKVLAGYVVYDNKCGRRPTIFMRVGTEKILAFIKKAMQ